VQAMVGHMSAAMVRYYTHISNRSARNAVELLDPKVPVLVGKFVGEMDGTVQSNPKLLN